MFFLAFIAGCLLASGGTPLLGSMFGHALIDHAAPAVIDITL